MGHLQSFKVTASESRCINKKARSLFPLSIGQLASHNTPLSDHPLRLFLGLVGERIASSVFDSSLYPLFVDRAFDSNFVLKEPFAVSFLHLSSNSIACRTTCSAGCMAVLVVIDISETVSKC